MRVALLEDDVDQAALLHHWLTDAGHHLEHFSDSEPFLRAVRRDSFDLYIMDWLLPTGSGIGVLGQLRARDPDGPPALFITVREDESSIVEALRAGADDYMIKPVRRSEMLARIDALMRRRIRSTRDSIEMPPYLLDLEEHRLKMNGEVVQLTEREFDLALFLFQRVGQIVSREHLLEGVWGVGNSTLRTRTVDTHISRLRRKLAFNENSNWRLTSIYQHGYRLENFDSPKSEG